jgi:hypothetical protein
VDEKGVQYRGVNNSLEKNREGIGKHPKSGERVGNF